MTNNYILRNVRFALNLKDSEMLEIFRISQREIDSVTLDALLKKEDEQGCIVCSDKLMGLFLDGLIVMKRGRNEGQPERVSNAAIPLTNNDILKKIRIAMELKEEDMLNIFEHGAVNMSGPELTALFRKPGHKHYKECGDQFLRYFLKGLAVWFRNK
jgi:uncharacterized protein YehS (DUF1456 family)